MPVYPASSAQSRTFRRFWLEGGVGFQVYIPGCLPLAPSLVPSLLLWAHAVCVLASM